MAQEIRLNPAMRISVAISLLILAVAVLIGLRDQRELIELRVEKEALASEAVALGIPPDVPSHADHEHQSRTKREREDKQEEARRAALDIIGLARELERLKESGDPADIATQDRILKALEQLNSLDSDQLRFLIEEFRQAGDLNDEMRGLLLQFGVGALVKRNPRDAIGMLAGNDNPIGDASNRSLLVCSALSEWSEADLSGAMAWMRTSKLDFLKQESMEVALVHGAARSDLGVAIDLMREFGVSNPGDVVQKMASNLPTLAEKGELLRLMKERPDQFGEKELNVALVTMGKSVGKDGYEEGVRWIEENELSESEITNLIAGGMVSHAKGAETGHWVEWMGGSLSAEPRDRFVSEQVRNWTEKDHRAAGEWLAALPDGPAKPASVAAFAKTVAPHDPKIAAEWALTLPPGGRRTETLKDVYRKWPEDDPARASFMAEHPAE